jgi:hypothetical protein
MKLVSAFWLVLFAVAALAGGPEDYDYILQKYVKGDYLDYAALVKSKEDRQRLDAFMDWQANADASKMSRDDRIASKRLSKIIQFTARSIFPAISINSNLKWPGKI